MHLTFLDVPIDKLLKAYKTKNHVFCILKNLIVPTDKLLNVYKTKKKFPK